ncbi:MAG: hypothetical protein GY915_07070 [bacterium]|nr:hypothetical protein [bacterium]
MSQKKIQLGILVALFMVYASPTLASFEEDEGRDKKATGAGKRIQEIIEEYHRGKKVPASRVGKINAKPAPDDS